jgi:flagellar basal-body rod modification protein FlgD
MTTPIQSSTPISSILGSPASAAPAAKDNLGKDAFLKLLVAQLRYQDPMNPADGTAFMSQTAQFTSLEKLGDLSTTATDQLANQMMLSASNMIGRTVTYTGTDGTAATGVVTAAQFSGSVPTLRVGNTDVPLPAVTEVRSTAG